MIIPYLLLVFVTLTQGSDEILKHDLEFQNELRMKPQPAAGTSKSCPQTAYRFPYRRLGDLIRVLQPVPDMEELTTCFTFKKSGHDDFDAILSYSSDIHLHAANDYLVGLKSDRICIFLISNHAECITASFTTNRIYHMCIATFAAHSGKSYVFINSRLEHIIHHATRGKIPGNGVLFLGSDQGTVGTTGSSTWLYEGEISNLMMWDRILDGDEIEKSYHNRCYCSSDYIIAPTPDIVQLHGGVAPTAINRCK